MFYGLVRLLRRLGGQSLRPAEPPASPSPRPSAGELGWSELADETEAFLQGDLPDLRAHNGDPLTVWMVLNRICHGDAVEVYDVAAGDVAHMELPGVSSAYHQVWNTTQRNLALRVLEVAPDTAGLRQLQHDVLVPLELHLITRSRYEALTFAQVLAATENALDHHQIDQ